MPRIVHNGKYSLRIGNTTDTAVVAMASRVIDIYSDSGIYFAWLAVLQIGHSEGTASFIMIELNDIDNNDTVIKRYYEATSSSAGADSRFSSSGIHYYTPAWQVEHLSIHSNRTGHRFSLTVTAAGCTSTSHRGYAYIDSLGTAIP
ncbi:unnamed protein product [Adineta steineri]|uniref:Uncharacterized protein n=1 Tax=Adineta steineri TaxID=433720 RepID=A0A815PTA7_9BILA|nr:unnamed protein product [Adineta steineri]CAF1631412.1 unnamed protein product [Adineta steineri]